MNAYSYQCVTKKEESLVWEKFKNGDHTALGRIFSTCYKTLFKFGTGLVGDEDMVKDCIQNLFEKLWLSREKLGSIDSIRPYLFKCLRYQLIDQLRETKRKTSRHQHHFEIFTISISSEERMIAEQSEAELRKKLLHSLAVLPNRQRQAVYLKIFEEMEYDKISTIMMLNVQSTRNLVHQAFKTLKTNRSQFGFYD